MIAWSAGIMESVKNDNFLVSPRADFWLLGGASILTWALLALGDQLAVVRDFLRTIRPEIFFFALALFSYPHFAASYWLAYSRGKKFLWENWFALFVLPFLLIAALAWLWSVYALIGELGMRLFFTVFVFMSGWHFAMQAFGAAVIGFHYDGIKLTPRQRHALKASLLSLWLFSFLARFDFQAEPVTYFGLQLYAIELPFWAYHAASAALTLVTIWAVYVLVIVPYDQTNILPSKRTLVPWISLFFWWLPALRSPEFYVYGTQLFHGLQMQAFTYRFERHRGRTQLGILLLAAALVALGFFVHWTVPVALDKTSLSPRPNYFFLCFSFTISIHHYFLDRATWRLGNAETRKLMLEPSAPSAPFPAAHSSLSP